MSIKFIEKTHSYLSTGEHDVEWTSVTSLISKYKEFFDQDAVAKKCVRNKKSKWYGLVPKDVKAIWKEEAKRATDLGTFYHNQREDELLSLNSLGREGKDLPIFRPVIDEEGVKHSPEQVLDEGVYPEHFVYLMSKGICGQADYVEVVNGKINIMDYKTNKEIKTSSYVDWEGNSKKMLAPLQHLDDCSLNHYRLQMSLYMYIMLKHNHHLECGTMTVRHVTFEKTGEDKYGYPITKLDPSGSPIVNDVIDYDLGYLKKDVLKLLKKIK